jgi:hypothetical protein
VAGTFQKWRAFLRFNKSLIEILPLNGAIANVASCSFYSLAHKEKREQPTRDGKRSQLKQQQSFTIHHLMLPI